MGVILILVGLIVVFGPKIPFLGRLPGDIHVQRENFRLYFPLTTSILLSLILSLILYLIQRFRQ
jgi:uncharacterized protein HemY